MRQPIAWTNWLLADMEAQAEFQRWAMEMQPKGVG